MGILQRPYDQKSIFAIIEFLEGTKAGSAEVADYLRAYRDSRRERRLPTEQIAKVSTSNELFNEVLARAISDIYTLVSHTEWGPYPYAGIPWFSTVFGRDGHYHRDVDALGRPIDGTRSTTHIGKHPSDLH